jgi:(4-alkanoyl-5-oxo-2,5-dihydrofuran-3-yl)methyl phosphate reductase
MQNLLGMVSDGAISTAAGDGRVGMVDIRDVAAVAVAALTGRGQEGRI